jgi:hypothetical protein
MARAYQAMDGRYGLSHLSRAARQLQPAIGVDNASFAVWQWEISTMRRIVVVAVVLSVIVLVGIAGSALARDCHGRLIVIGASPGTS